MAELSRLTIAFLRGGDLEVRLTIAFIRGGDLGVRLTIAFIRGGDLGVPQNPFDEIGLSVLPCTNTWKV